MISAAVAIVAAAAVVAVVFAAMIYDFILCLDLVFRRVPAVVVKQNSRLYSFLSLVYLDVKLFHRLILPCSVSVYSSFGKTFRNNQADGQRIKRSADFSDARGWIGNKFHSISDWRIASTFDLTG